MHLPFKGFSYCCLLYLKMATYDNQDLNSRRYANRGLGYQERAVLLKKAEQAKARGEAPPDEPGMQHFLADLKNATTVSDLLANG